MRVRVWGRALALYRPVDVMTTHQRKEHVADYFAACLLMPRLWVGRYCKNGVHSVEKLASLFGVSSARMWLRLESLGLLEAEGEDREARY
jgi:Zn-dependent peptidase ImmA (M78 family)